MTTRPGAKGVGACANVGGKKNYFRAPGRAHCALALSLARKLMLHLGIALASK